jgi:cation:H+ antiporter
VDYFWLILCFAGILVAAELFTNAVEWIGYRYKLGGGGVGSVLAAVGTALPETMIPLIAFLAGYIRGDPAEFERNKEVGIGAILGAPFMLSCVAFAVAGIAKSAYHRTGRRERAITQDPHIFRRDLGFFVIMYSMAILCSFFPRHWMKMCVAGVLLLSYAYYVFLTFKGDKPDIELPKACLFDRNCETPRMWRIWTQVIFSLVLIIGLAHFFVEEVKNVSNDLSINPLVLALIIAPLATELPEKFNSVIWMRDQKDTLALGNIAGAMVFQSTFPVSIGIFITDWTLWDKAHPDSIFAILAALFALLAGCYFLILDKFGIRIRSRLLAMPFLLYIIYIIIIVSRSGGSPRFHDFRVHFTLISPIFLYLIGCILLLRNCETVGVRGLTHPGQRSDSLCPKPVRKRYRNSDTNARQPASEAARMQSSASIKRRR